jgi:hypothetical protein
MTADTDQPATTTPLPAAGPKLPPFLGDCAPAGRPTIGSPVDLLAPALPADPARRMWGAALLTSAAPLAAAAALAAAPLAAIPVASPAGAHHAATLAGEDCGTSQPGTGGLVKWPDCAGD